MTKTAIAGWAVSLFGTVLWIYGYLVAGHPALVRWSAFAPSWISEYLPNIESEIGLLLALVGMIGIYWPSPQTQ